MIALRFPFRQVIKLIVVICLAMMGGCISKTGVAVETTQSGSSLKRTPSFPFGDASEFQYTEDDCAGATIDMGKCVKGEAYKAARELDTLLVELDSQFPNGTWEEALQEAIMPQEKWESLKYPACEFGAQDYMGGTHHSNAIMYCVTMQNKNRIHRLVSLICMETKGFSRCTPEKSGGEVPSITAVPITPAP